MRAQRGFSVAEDSAQSLGNRHRNGGRTSIRVWCRHASPLPVQGNQLRTRDRVPTSLDGEKRKQGKKLRSQEEFASGQVGTFYVAAVVKLFLLRALTDAALFLSPMW